MLGDQPGVSSATVEELLAGRGDSALAACAYEDGRGHPLAFARSMFDALASLHGDKGVWKLLDRHAAEVVDVPIPGTDPARRRHVGGLRSREARSSERERLISAPRRRRSRPPPSATASRVPSAGPASRRCRPGPVEIACVASEVVANRCSASAAGTARSRPSVLACHISSIGVPRTSIRVSARRRTSSITECASVSRMPSPAAAAAIAAA